MSGYTRPLHYAPSQHRTHTQFPARGDRVRFLTLVTKHGCELITLRLGSWARLFYILSVKPSERYSVRDRYSD